MKRLMMNLTEHSTGMNMMQSYIDKYFFFLLTFALVFTIILYYPIGFQFTDELCIAALFLLFLYGMLKTPDWAFNKVFLFTLGVFLFYTAYSVLIGSNGKRAIFTDLIIQMKPYIAFFCVYQLKPLFNPQRKKLLKDITLLFWFVFLLPLGIAGAINEDVLDIMGHPAIYGIAITIVGLTFLYCSDFSKRDKLIFLLLLFVGIFSGRSKFYGFIVLSVFFALFSGQLLKFKWSLKNILIILIALGLMFFVAWEKIYLYFVQAMVENPEVDEDMMARFVFYRTMPNILSDYFPFGSGFASFATYPSAVFYSDTYAEYGLNMVYGLTRDDPKFASDTFYPALAQFGVAGIILYILFWMYILRRAFLYFRVNPKPQLKSLITVILIIAFITIEGTSASTFIAQGGFYVMMLAGLILSEMKVVNEKLAVPEKPD
jgi:hypothetical protein